MADIGYIALFLALLASIYSAVAYAFGATGSRRQALLDSARNGLLAATGLISISAVILIFAFLTHNFQIEYVYSYSSSDTRLAYLISGLWAGNAGSLLVWAWFLSIFAAIVALQKRNVGNDLLPYASTIIMATQAFFLILLLVVSNPFTEFAFRPPEGLGLNPLLENPGMVIHPPALLAGYVGFTIPFAFAIAALLSGRLGDEWIVAIRKWMLVAWLFLGIGNVLGAWWAYVELGWGGFWAWDPVENAGFMPWLVATAFLHSIMMQRRRGMLKIWNMLLIILTFGLSIFGTFLTRSGILSSVHTFNDTNLGPFFLIFLIITLVGSLGLLLYRREELKSEAEMESLVSRESTFLLNNLLLVGSAFAIFLGTVFPVISEAVRGTKITVAAPFFNQVNGPIFLGIILLTGVCSLIGWRRTSIKNLIRNFLWPLSGAIILSLILIVTGIGQGYALIAFFLCSFVLFTISYEWFRGTRARHRMRSENYLKAFFGLIGANRPRYGGYIVHIAMIFITVGVVGTTFYGTETQAIIKPGETITINGYSLLYDKLDSYSTQSRDVVNATFIVSHNDKIVGELITEKYFDKDYQPVTEVDIHYTLLEDLYVILLGSEEDETAAFKVLINPLVNWIWIGGGILLLGGLIVLWPERQQLPASNVNKTRR
ncbi:heme lyase CcmF/NrfE family subunit [Chloroflexota bacterium]